MRRAEVTGPGWSVRELVSVKGGVVLRRDCPLPEERILGWSVRPSDCVPGRLVAHGQTTEWITIPPPVRGRERCRVDLYAAEDVDQGEGAAKGFRAT